MNLQYFGITLLFSLVGYLIGSVSFPIIISKMLGHGDIREKGSGNAGSTNVARQLGMKIGVLNLFLDMGKSVVAVAIAWSVKNFSNWEMAEGMWLQPVAFAVVIGHAWPVYHQFKGGKGAATIAGFIFTIQWYLWILGVVLFFVYLAISKRVSVATLSVIPTLTLIQIGMSFVPEMHNKWMDPMMHDSEWWISSMFLGFSIVLVTWKHRANIQRLMNGTERTIKDLKKK